MRQGDEVGMGKEHSLVSVIVPVCNVEAYLRECLDSISHQSYKNIEILAVDDGSIDSSGKICDEYMRCDRRFRVFHQDNKGVVSARNEGVCQAKGDYICFVDADDKINVRMVEHLVNSIEDTDIATCGVFCEKSNGDLLELKDAFPEGKYASPKEMNVFFSNLIRFHREQREGILPYVYAKLYRKDKLYSVAKALDNRITYGEDRELVYRYMLMAESISVTHNQLYFYRFRKDSALNSINTHALHDINYLYEALRNIFANSNKAAVLLPQLEMLVLAKISMAPKFMGFSPRFEPVRYLFPYYNFFHGDRIVLYGAGRVGWNYYYQTRHIKDIDYVLWVDKKYRSEEVQGVDAIFETDYDYILIAVLDENVAQSIIRELSNLGIPRKKMLWRKPILLYDE